MQKIASRLVINLLSSSSVFTSLLLVSRQSKLTLKLSKPDINGSLEQVNRVRRTLNSILLQVLEFGHLSSIFVDEELKETQVLVDQLLEELEELKEKYGSPIVSKNMSTDFEFFITYGLHSLPRISSRNLIPLFFV